MIHNHTKTSVVYILKTKKLIKTISNFEISIWCYNQWYVAFRKKNIVVVN